ncbi:MAG: hypothetical protein P1V81_09580 [Planctomycetota bacterium]|nr:hypothetical protein [Planctomycetota bacterium]
MFPLALFVLPLQWGADPVDPVDVLSPGGALRLHVESVERDGEGPGVYSLFEGDTERWRAELPFHLSDIWLGPDGGAFGCGVAHSPETYFELVVAQLDPEGKVLFDERTTMRSPRAIHGSPTPQPRGLVPDPANDRVWVRVFDGYAPDGFESWWGYRLSTGERIGAIEPERDLRAPFQQGKRSLRVDQACPSQARTSC